MLALKILIVFILILLLIGLVRVGALIGYAEDVLSVSAAVGPLRIRILPKKEKPDKTKKKAKPKQKKPKKEDKKPFFPKPGFSDIRPAVDALWPPLKKALRRTRRGICVNPLEVHVVLGGREDPASAAEQYGYVNAAIWTGMPVLEQLLRIKNPSLGADINFEESKTDIRARACVTLRIGTLVAVGLQMGIPALKWFLKYKKQKEQQAAEEAVGKRQKKSDAQAPAA